jgi:aminopeptidase N
MPMPKPRAIALAPLLAVLAPATLGADRLTGGELETELRGSEACRHGKLEHAALTAYEDTTGRNLRNFPPDRVVDHLHMKLEMRFDDLNDMRFSAVETLRVTPLGGPTRSLTLDAVGLDVQAVRLGAASVETFRDDETITLRFDPPLAMGAEHEIVFEYVCEHPYAGMTFTPDADGMPGYTAEVHTQGQTITNRHWFIAHDSPNERMTTELIVDVPAKYSVSSNGRLVSQFVNDDRAVWHWSQEQPHVSYLVSLVIGDFDVVDIPHARVPMKVWVPRGKGDQVQQTYGRTGAMLDVFEERFGVPYPWARYDQLVVKNFGAGGMENTSATTMYPTAILDATALLDRDLEGLIAHELAHQWTGDLITCKEWAHIWLNEGFATYGESLWYEKRDGWDGYLDDTRRNFRTARRDRTPGTEAMVSPVYDHPRDTFRRAGNPYPKGASVLHMLRSMLGDDVFFRGLQLYMNRHALGTVETDDFRYALEEVSGRGLEWFFDQWCYRPGTPDLAVSVEYGGEKRELVVEVEQKQHMDARTPAFRFTLPVHVRTASGDTVHMIDVDERTTSFRAVLDGVPSYVAIDPDLHVLCTMEVDKPQQMWTNQANDGPTTVARYRAINAIGDTDTADHRSLLASIVRDGERMVSERNAAVSALAGYGSDESKAAVLALLEEGVDEAKVRVNLVRALGDHDLERVGALLAQIAGGDASYATRVAAINTLGSHEAEAYADLIVDLVEFDSQHDQVRGAALSALADLDDARGLDLAIRYAAFGYMDRSRPTAIAAIGTLADHDHDRAVETLLDLLDDPCRRPSGSAGRALARLGDERAVKPFEAIADSHPNPRRRDEAKRWLETLRKEMKKKDGKDG